MLKFAFVRSVFRWRLLLMLVGFWLAAGSVAFGQAIRDLPGFRSNTLERNDDESTLCTVPSGPKYCPVDIGFDVNFFGRTYSKLYVNNNGNVTFEAPLRTYVPFGLAATNTPIIAAFFADVDTRPPESGVVTYGRDTVNGRQAFGVNYFRVGRYNMDGSHLNTFQLILIDRSDTGTSNFDIEFNYAQIQWDLGSSSGGVAAVVGFSNGTGQANSLFQLPGSMSNGALLDNGANGLVRGRLNSNIAGRYVFEARSGTVHFLRITTDSLPAGTVARQYSSPALAATGGVAPYVWSTVNWPAGFGLTLESSTGVISGTPAHAGTYNLIVQVTDQVGTSPANKTLTLAIRAGQQALQIPYLIEPQEAVMNTPVHLVAGLRLSDEGPPIPARDLPQPTSIQVLVEGQTVILHDDGLDGDQVAGDGRYTGQVTFRRPGNIPVTIRATNSMLDRSVQAFVKVRFVYKGPVDLDLGTLTAGSESCRVLPLDREQEAEIPIEFRLLRRLPAEHTLLLRSGKRSYRPGDEPLTPSPGESMQVCLDAGARVPSSDANGESWIELIDASGGTTQDLIAINLRWRVDGLTFWQRWWWLFLVFIALLLIAFLVYGYIKPHRFPREMGVTFVPDYDDLDQSPQPLVQWPGVGIGFYRDAQAFLHPDFRVSGKSRGALGMLKAVAGRVLVVPTDVSLYRELDVTEWEEIPSQGCPARAAVAYRFGERGPFFRISTGRKR